MMNGRKGPVEMHRSGKTLFAIGNEMLLMRHFAQLVEIDLSITMQKIVLVVGNEHVTKEGAYFVRFWTNYGSKKN